MLCLKFFPLQIHIIIRQIQSIHNIILIGAVKYGRRHIKAKGLCSQAQMNLQYLSNIHTGRHAERIQYNIQRTSVGQERHILYRKHTRYHTLVAVAACHLISYGNLSLLCDINANRLIHSRRQLVAVLSGKYLGVYHNSIFSVRNLQRGISYFPSLLSKNSTQKTLLRRQLCLSLRSYLSNQNIAGANLRADADNSALIQIL